jgi:hypothetical protein
LAADPVARSADAALDIGAYEAGTVLGVIARRPGARRIGAGMLWDGRGMAVFGTGSASAGEKPAFYHPDGRAR